MSSDLSRAYDTARTIRGDLPVQRDPRWREFAFGQWEGLTWEQILERWPHLRDQPPTAASLYTPEGGESFDAVAARVSRSLHELREAGYANALVVTHAGPLHAMLHTLFGEREAEMAEALAVRFSPASVTRIVWEEDGAQLLTLNGVAHLPE